MNDYTDTLQHIAIIMDGNRRWAKERGLPVLEGHRRVADHVLEPLVEHAADLGVKYITLWAWSTENWKRKQTEVTGIMNLLRHGFKKFGEKLHKKGVRIKLIGNIAEFAPDIQKSLRYYEELTQNNTRITLVCALNYGGRDEILRAIRKLDRISGVAEEAFSQNLDTAGIPDPELIIRTGGEQRLSGFLLWQAQYSEFLFPTWYMPEFTPQRLDEAVTEFERRKRRFGK